MTKLKPLPTGTLKQYLEQDVKWIDLVYGDEDGGVVTFLTISELLYDEWHESQSELFDWKKEFKLERVTKPGIYRDDELHGEHGSEKCYTIVVNFDFLAEKMMRDKIEELNKQYGENFEISYEESRTVELDEDEKVDLK